MYGESVKLIRTLLLRVPLRAKMRHFPPVHRREQRRAPSGFPLQQRLPRREFLFVDDLADACVFVLEHYTGESHLNVGSREEVTIADAAKLVGEVIGYKGKLVFDTSRPDGTPRKLLDSSKLNQMGWQAGTTLREGLKLTYSEFIARFPEVAWSRTKVNLWNNARLYRKPRYHLPWQPNHASETGMVRGERLARYRKRDCVDRYESNQGP